MLKRDFPDGVPLRLVDRTHESISNSPNRRAGGTPRRPERIALGTSAAPTAAAAQAAASRTARDVLSARQPAVLAALARPASSDCPPLALLLRRSAAASVPRGGPAGGGGGGNIRTWGDIEVQPGGGGNGAGGPGPAGTPESRDTFLSRLPQVRTPRLYSQTRAAQPLQSPRTLEAFHASVTRSPANCPSRRRSSATAA